MHVLSLLLSTVLVQSQPVQASSPAARPFPLMVGNPAPALAAARWLKGAPVASFEQGHVYVIEFWATWCGPCVRGIPHLTELQERFAGKVQVIGVDVWEPEPAKVEPFVKDMGARMEYSIAVDDVPAAPADCDQLFLARQGVVAVRAADGVPRGDTGCEGSHRLLECGGGAVQVAVHFGRLQRILEHVGVGDGSDNGLLDGQMARGFGQDKR